MVARRHRFTAAEYLAWERDQPTKHEYFRGEVFAMAGASARHSHLCSRVNRALDEALGPRGCYVLSSDQRGSVDHGERYVYPDVTVVCGAPVIERDDVLTNPTMIVEVLSRSTEPNDRGSKWQSYQQLGSLTDCVLVAQWAPRIEHFVRDGNGGWSYRSAGPGERIVLANGDALEVDAVFARAFDLPGDPEPPSAPDPDRG
jgi:Uma2 family endonuclease